MARSRLRKESLYEFEGGWRDERKHEIGAKVFRHQYDMMC